MAARLQSAEESYVCGRFAQSGGVGHNYKSRLVILDDLMNEADDRVTQLTVYKGKSSPKHERHVYCAKLVWQNTRSTGTISLQSSHYLVILKNPRDASQITHLAKQMYPGKIKVRSGKF